MNKSNKVLLGLLAFVVVCVVGYALFSEDISVTGSATASGDWSITASCSDTIPDEVMEDYGTGDIPGGYSETNCSASGNTITSSTTLLYPSAMKLYNAQYKNNGSVNAVFKMGDDATTVLQDAASQEGALTGKMDLYDKKTNQLFKSYSLYEALEMDNYGMAFIDKVYIKSTSGVYLNTKEEILGNGSLYKDAEGNYYLQIKPGESLVFILGAHWYDRAVQTDYYSIFEMSLDMKINQQTDDLIEVTNLDGTFDICINHC